MNLHVHDVHVLILILDKKLFTPQISTTLPSKTEQVVSDLLIFKFDKYRKYF